MNIELEPLAGERENQAEEIAPGLGAALVAAEPTEAFESKLRLVAKESKASASKLDAAFVAAGAVCDLTVHLPEGGELRLKVADGVVFCHCADCGQKVRLVFNGEILRWFVRKVIDWSKSEGLSVGVRRVPGLNEKAKVRFEFSQPFSFEISKLVAWDAVPLRPFTARVADDTEVEDLFKITFGADGVTADLPLPAFPLKVPYGPEGTPVKREARLDYDGVSWTLSMGGRRDVDFLHRPVVVADNAVVERFPWEPPPAMPDSKPIARPIQYWTPDGWNAWVGDCAAIRWGGRVHVFYLFDRRHHRSKNGGGGHYFAHISSADLVNWTEHPDAVAADHTWEYIGTGMPADIGGKLHLFYGLHTNRYGRGWERFPIGGSYVTSDDGIHFKKSGHYFTDDQNPSPYVRDDGRIGIVHSFCSADRGEWTAPSLNGPWTKLDDAIPTGGDCPCPFVWNGWHYIVQGFIGMAASRTGAPGSYEDWVLSGDDIYDGLCVPVSAAYGDNRRLLLGWITHPDGWGGWLCFRELIQFPDGRLGTKWADEIPPPEEPLVFDVAANADFALRFARADGEADDLEFRVEPGMSRAQFANVENGVAPRIPTLSERARAARGETDYDRYLARYKDAPDRCNETAIGKVRGLGEPYRVRLALHYDPKGETTIFDAEIAARRTLICIRRGKWKVVSRV